MSHESHAPEGSGGRKGAGLYIALTATAAIIAALAAQTSLSLGLTPWAMFMGWIAYFTRRPSAREGAQSLGCILLGLCLGAIATMSIAALAPVLGPAAFPSVVLAVALVVIATRGLPILNNLLGYFIGLVTFFAAHLEPELMSIAKLGGATALGSAAGWLAQTTQNKVRGAVAA